MGIYNIYILYIYIHTLAWEWDCSKIVCGIYGAAKSPAVGNGWRETLYPREASDLYSSLMLTFCLPQRGPAHLNFSNGQ